MHSTGSPWTRSKSKGDRVSCLHALQPTCSILQQSSFTGEGLPLSPHRNDPLPARRSSFTVLIIPKPHRRSRQNVIFCRSACHELSVECATGSEQVKRNQQSRQLTVYSAPYLRRISCTFTRPMPWPLSFLVVAGRRPSSISRFCCTRLHTEMRYSSGVLRCAHVPPVAALLPLHGWHYPSDSR